MKWIENEVNVLLIDNDEDDYILICHLLTEIAGVKFNLDWMQSYQTGLEKIALKQHHVYLVDYRLGSHSGLDLLQAATELGCQAPIILLTGQQAREIDLAAMEAGAVDFLAKDQITSLLLERSIRYAIERKRSETELKTVKNELEKSIAKRTAQLLETNDILQEKITELEQLKQQIQDSLTRRTRQVETSTETAQEIATSPDLEQLFYGVVNLVQEHFGYYHVQVYTLEAGQLIMQEGTGETSRQLKELNHGIPLQAEKSLVAQAARQKEPILVTDVYQAPNWLPNPLLSKTQSEIALPIKLGDEVLGVLDVQTDRVDGLSQEDQLLLMGLCGQIAVAINNGRLEAKRKRAVEAQQKLIEELDAFAHTIGHNLRDPLALIIGYTNLLKVKARLPEDLQEYLNAIARNGHKMGNIIDELELLAGIRKAKVEQKPLNMARIIAEVQHRLAYLREEYQAKIIVSEYWPTALGHKPWVEEVWANYLSNAIKYGGQPPVVRIGATAQSDGMIRFWVRDNGNGLNLEEKTHLFEELMHLNQIQIRGYGLGLSIVRRIVTKLGGQVDVKSEGVPGQGSVFSFTLPGVQNKEHLE